jgi:hypothetical protein
MTKKSTTFAVTVIVVLNLSLPTLPAQAVPSAKVNNRSAAPVARMQAAREKPCWQVAGISKSQSPNAHGLSNKPALRCSPCAMILP